MLSPQRQVSRLVRVSIIFAVALFTAAAFNAWMMYRDFKQTSANDLRIVELAGSIVHFDEVLTSSARMAAYSGDAKWEERYRSIEPILDGNLKETLALAPEAFEGELAGATEAANRALVEMESRTFALVRRGDREQALSILSSDEYAAQKQIYADGISDTVRLLKERADKRIASYTRSVQVSSVAGLLFLVLSAVLMVRVQQGMLKLRSTQEQLVASARSAGMAEIAVGVLHEVGNVLNSVNVGAQVTKDRLKGCRTSTLERALEMLRSERDPAAFLATEKGRRLLELLGKATGQITEGIASALGELEGLQSKVDHIKIIVAAQQEHANTRGSVEPFQLAEVVESACIMSEPSFEERAVDLVFDLDDVRELVADKHKVMQILVNLISNARQATLDAESTSRRIEIVAKRSSDRARIEVRDSGVGIAPEVMAKLFQHGFTTKKNGHGFALHSSANAARELGGSLSATSEGTGKGAVFVLEMPVSGRSRPHEDQPQVR